MVHSRTGRISCKGTVCTVRVPVGRRDVDEVRLAAPLDRLSGMNGLVFTFQDKTVLLSVVLAGSSTKSGDVVSNTVAFVAWKSLGLVFDVPLVGSDRGAGESWVRVSGMRPGAKRAFWGSFASTPVKDGCVRASMGRWIAIGPLVRVWFL